jgi:hemerythrin-like metal-binding protein
MGLVWDPELVTGNRQVDEQHVRIFQIFDDLLGAIQMRKGHEEVGRVVSSLSLYVVAHFRMEETLMDQGGYPGLEDHRSAHEALKIHVEAMVDQFNDGVLAPLTLLNFMKHWLDDHVVIHDKPMVRFLITAEVPDASVKPGCAGPA